MRKRSFAARVISSVGFAVTLLIVAAIPLAGHVKAAELLDVVFVLDNSGSMRENDPQFLTRKAVKNFASTLAENADVPVINGLTDRSHPCQLMADVMTFSISSGDTGSFKYLRMLRRFISDSCVSIFLLLGPGFPLGLTRDGPPRMSSAASYRLRPRPSRAAFVTGVRLKSPYEPCSNARRRRSFPRRDAGGRVASPVMA